MEEVRIGFVDPHASMDAPFTPVWLRMGRLTLNLGRPRKESHHQWFIQLDNATSKLYVGTQCYINEMNAMCKSLLSRQGLWNCDWYNRPLLIRTARLAALHRHCLDSSHLTLIAVNNFMFRSFKMNQLPLLWGTHWIKKTHLYTLSPCHDDSNTLLQIGQHRLVDNLAWDDGLLCGLHFHFWGIFTVRQTSVGWTATRHFMRPATASLGTNAYTINPYWDIESHSTDDMGRSWFFIAFLGGTSRGEDWILKTQ